LNTARVEKWQENYETDDETILINTSRGEVLDETAATEALKSGRL